MADIDNIDIIIHWARQQRWSDYCRKLLLHFERHGTLTDQQVETALRMRDRGALDHS